MVLKAFLYQKSNFSNFSGKATSDLCVKMELYKYKISLCFAKRTGGRTLIVEPEFVRDEGRH